MEIDPQSIAVCTTTFYKDWFEGNADKYQLLRNEDQKLAEGKIRGDIALETAQSILRSGYQLILVDGAKGSAFQKELKRLGIPFMQEKGKGMSASRVQAFNEAFSRPKIQVCGWMEPEKACLVEEIDKCAAPILSGETQIVIPERQERGWGSLPGYQRDSERKGNEIYNDKLHRSGLLPKEESLDVYFGPRFYSAMEPFRDLMRQILNSQYSFDKNDNIPLHATVNPGAYSEATFFPIPAALNNGLAVKSVPVDFAYIGIQKRLEECPAFANGPNGYIKKRSVQQTGILTEHVNYLRSIGRLSGNNRLRRKQ